MKKINPRFPDYDIQDDGRVFRARYSKIGKGTRSSHIGAEIKGRILLSGYRQFNLVLANGEGMLVRANRLIAETFLGPPPSPKHHCAHNDGNKLNNHITNLRWATPKENSADMDTHGTRRRGPEAPKAKLSNEDIAEIRASFTGKRGELLALAMRYGVGASTMGRAIFGETYCEAAPISAGITRGTRLTPAQHAEILSTYISSGYAAARPLAVAYGIQPKCISALARKHGYCGNHLRGRGIIGCSALDHRA